MYDAVIIGAGMSGLAAGIRLAHYEQRVCILERHSTIGGLNSFYRLNGRDYDAGLHAVTNYAPKGTRRGPLAKILRQLRLAWDELSLSPQLGSTIAFPGVSLRFHNDLELLASEIATSFPDQRDGFRRLVEHLLEYDQLGTEGTGTSAREVTSRFISDPLLVDMIFCPLLYYGGSRERDMDFAQFSIMFRALFMEGLARPLAGARLILKKLVRKFKNLGGDLKLRTGVKKIITSGTRADRIVLDDGSELLARRIVSSAGWNETMRLCDNTQATEHRPQGQLSFIETISILDKHPKPIGLDRTLVFFNDSSRFLYEKPDGLADSRSGVICVPNNFAFDEPMPEGIVRITSLANHDRWASLDEEAYRLEKLRWYDRTAAAAARFVPDFRGNVVDFDMFTPTTIRRFTGHDNGAVYGAPVKRYDGRTHLENLYVCGTDQGMVGIVGSILSGITIANQYCLRA